tara:strand:- start:294 stop:599 length:306 start_codon:yes stop_codon:yes gene_type:complete
VNNHQRNRPVSFKKEEINQIMEVYSKKISIGEWKDYSMTFKNDYAIFSIHKSFKLGPTFQIKKNKYKKLYSLIFRNNIVTTSYNLQNLINYLKKPDLKLVK